MCLCVPQQLKLARLKWVWCLREHYLETWIPFCRIFLVRTQPRSDPKPLSVSHRESGEPDFNIKQIIKTQKKKKTSKKNNWRLGQSQSNVQIITRGQYIFPLFKVNSRWLFLWMCALRFSAHELIKSFKEGNRKEAGEKEEFKFRGCRDENGNYKPVSDRLISPHRFLSQITAQHKKEGNIFVNICIYYMIYNFF